MSTMEADMSLQQVLIHNIKKFRTNFELTQQQVADALHMNRSTYAYYELGRTLITIDLIYQLAALYEVDISAFLQDESPRIQKLSDHTRPVKFDMQLYNLSDAEQSLCLQYRSQKEEFPKDSQPYLTLIPPSNRLKKYDLVVCGGGTAGVAAAICAARQGANVLLIERNNALGGTLTLSNVSFIMDLSDKQGFARELVERMQAEGAGVEIGKHAPVDQEYMRFLLEEMCLEAGVTLRYYTQVIGVSHDHKKVTSLQLFSKNGMEQVSAKAYIDATGDGDVCAMAGCGFELGDEGGHCQPMSFNVVVSGVQLEEIAPYCIHVPGGGEESKRRLRALLESLGVSVSYTMPFFMPFPGETDRFILACHHQYHASAISAEDLTQATLDGRRECFRVVRALKESGGIWKNLKIVQSPQSIGVREGRRIHGKYCVTKEDLIHGVRHDPSACHVTFNVDIHCKDDGYTTGGVTVKSEGYDIPLEAMVAHKFSNLYMAGRCISGDFYAHASYRVMGNTLQMGETLGTYCGKRYSARKSKATP